MNTLLNRLKIVHKLNLSFGIIVLLVFGLIGFSYNSMLNLKAIFGDYRETARESLILANLSEDLADARIAVLKYRLGDSPELQAEVASNIQEIVDADEQIRAVVTSQKHLDLLKSLELQAVEYGAVFEQAADQQAQRHVVVAELDKLGPAIRKDISEIMDTAYADGDPVAAYYAGISQQHLMLLRLYAQKFLLRNDPADVERAIAEADSAAAQMDTLLNELQNPRRRELAMAVKTGLASYADFFTQSAEIIATRNSFYFEGLDALGPQIINGYDNLFEDVQNKQNQLGPQAVATMNDLSRNSIIVGVVIGVLASIFALVIGRFMQRNFALITDQMERLSGGDKSFEIEGADRNDEIGEMGKALQVFRANALEVERLEEEQKQNEVKQAEERRQATLEMANQFEERVGGVVQSVEEAASNMQGMASSLSSAVQETTHQSGNVASASQEATTNVQAVAAAAEQMASSIREISTNVADTASMTKDCSRAAEVSQDKLRDLSHAVDEIDSVIQSISDVAEQTNLLALNATIESARAGDAGKGFAVVANEVKSLANETHKMTEEISRKVAGIKSSAQETITSVNDIISQISTVDEKTTSVAAAIEEQDASTTEISRNVQEVASGTNEVSRSIEQVKVVANDSADSTEQLKTAATDLAGRASDLKSAVNAFLTEVRAA